MGVETDGETRILDGLLNAVYVGLHTAAPTGGNEIAGGAYARQSFVYTLSGANPKTASNSGTIQFPTATTNWGVITHAAIWSASTGGSILATMPLVDAKDIAIDDVFRFLTGKLSVVVD
jgi:hypothetical protein